MSKWAPGQIRVHKLNQQGAMSNKREWTWNHRSDGQDGVHIEGDHLVWWSENWAAPFASGGACEQTFEALLESGPVDRAIPQSDLAELRETIMVMLNRL